MLQARRAQGQMSFEAGQSAEAQVILHYQRMGYVMLHHRWCGEAGEIDLILGKADQVIFVEVKKSRDFARAARSLSHRQMQRIYASAEEFLAQMPQGSLTPARFDVALLDATGMIQIIENAFDAG